MANDKHKRTPLDRSLHALRSGDMSWEQFYHQHRGDLERLATNLRGRWGRQCAGSHGTEDVAQDLLVGVWQVLGKWDPDRGPTLERYVVWHACQRAKDGLHRARGSSLHGSRDRNPSRAAVPVSALVSDEASGSNRSHSAAERVLDARASAPPDAHARLLVRDVVAAGGDRFERAALTVLANTGDPGLALCKLRERQGALSARADGNAGRRKLAAAQQRASEVLR